MKVLFLIPPSKSSRNVARDLVYGCWCKGKRIGGISFPPISLLEVASVIKNEGHHVLVLDAPATQTPLSKLKNIIKKYNFVVILTSTMSINEDSEILSLLKKANPRLKTIVFGGHPTSMPRYTLAKPGIDFIVRCESEYIIKDLINAYAKNNDSWKKVRGIGFKQQKKIIINPPYPLIKNLDDLPFPDRSMLPKNIDYFNPVVKRMPYTTIFTSRGCPGRCTFCASPIFYGRKIRYRSANSVLAELTEISKLGYKEVFIRDEIFTVNRKRVVAICNGIIKNNLDLTWIASSRIDTIDKPLLKLMKKAGCHLVRLGVESGVQEILNNVKKGIKVTQTKKVFKYANSVNIDTHAHLMIGMPGDNEKTIKQTIDFVKEINPTIATFGICTPYPGTELFSFVAKTHPEIADGSKADLSNLHTQAFYNDCFTSLNKKELAELLKHSYKSFYLRPSYIFSWLKKINSLDEAKRVILAGLTVFDFALGKDE